MREDIWQSVRWHWNAMVDTKTDDLDFKDCGHSEQEEEEEGGTEPHQSHQPEQAAQWEWNDRTW